MRNVLGELLTLTLFGESHGPYVGATLDGVPSGLKVDEEKLQEALTRRRAIIGAESARVEEDHFQIISGVFNGYTTGAPLTIIIENTNTLSSDYKEIKDTPRPSHADYTAHVKYQGFEDYRGGGHFSGRITAAIVAVSSIIINALEEKGIYIGTHIKKCGTVLDRNIESIEDIKTLNQKNIPLLNDLEGELLTEFQNKKNELDSIGGITETCVIGLPVGLGEPWFSSAEGLIANAVLSIGGIKGIEFGEGFNFANLTGKTANDEFQIVDGKVITLTNHNGGINGGITNGMPVTFNCAIKPTPSIATPQKSIIYESFENKELVIKGRHDPAIIRKIAIVISSMTALVMMDLLLMAKGSEYFKK